MATPGFFDWFQFGVLVSWGTLGVTRAIWFRARGVRVIASDRRRTLWEMLADLLALACLLVWAYGVVAYAWSFGFHVGSTSLDRVLVDDIALKVLGAVAGTTALLIYAIAPRDLGASWRLGIDRDTPGPLVTTGIYRRSRHPIYVAFDLLFAGTFLANGHLVFLVLAAVWLPLQHVFMLREERFLTPLHGGAYRDYCDHVGRYCSWRGPKGTGFMRMVYWI